MRRFPPWILTLALLLPGASLLMAICDPFNPEIDPTLDYNCDGRTQIYCGFVTGAVDLYDNALVQGFLVMEGGTYVLVGDSPGSKAEKAAKLGVPTISEDDLKVMLGV